MIMNRLWLALALATILCAAAPAYAQSTREAPSGSGQRFQGVILIDPTTGNPIAGGGGGGGGGAITAGAGSYSAGAFVAGTGIDGWDLTQGTKADSAYAGSGSSSVVGILKGIYNLLLAPLPAGTNTIGSVRVQDGSGTALSTTLMGSKNRLV